MSGHVLYVSVLQTCPEIFTDTILSGCCTANRMGKRAGLAVGPRGALPGAAAPTTSDGQPAPLSLRAVGDPRKQERLWLLRHLPSGNHPLGKTAVRVGRGHTRTVSDLKTCIRGKRTNPEQKGASRSVRPGRCVLIAAERVPRGRAAGREASPPRLMPAIRHARHRARCRESQENPGNRYQTEHKLALSGFLRKTRSPGSRAGCFPGSVWLWAEADRHRLHPRASLSNGGRKEKSERKAHFRTPRSMRSGICAAQRT